MTDNITTVNSHEELERLVDGAIVSVKVRFSEHDNHAPIKAMLHEKIVKKNLLGTKQGHRFIGMFDAVGGSLSKAIGLWDFYGDKGLSFYEGTIVLEGGRVRMGYTLPTEPIYTQKESQLRQAGLYNG